MTPALVTCKQFVDVLPRPVTCKREVEAFPKTVRFVVVASVEVANLEKRRSNVLDALTKKPTTDEVGDMEF